MVNSRDTPVFIVEYHNYSGKGGLPFNLLTLLFSATEEDAPCFNMVSPFLMTYLFALSWGEM